MVHWVLACRQGTTARVRACVRARAQAAEQRWAGDLEAIECCIGEVPRPCTMDRAGFLCKCAVAAAQAAKAELSERPKLVSSIQVRMSAHLDGRDMCASGRVSG